MIKRILYYWETKDDGIKSNAKAYDAAYRFDPEEKAIARIGIETYFKTYKKYPVHKGPTLFCRIFDPNDPNRERYTDKLYEQSEKLSIADLIAKLFSNNPANKFQADFEKRYKERTNGKMMPNKSNEGQIIELEKIAHKKIGKLGQFDIGDPNTMTDLETDIIKDLSMTHPHGKDGHLIPMEAKKK